MKKVLLILFALFSTASLFAQQKPFDIEHAPAPLFRCPIYDGPTIRPWNEMDGMDVEENTRNYHWASIQIAELEYVEGKIVCDRDRYFKKVPSSIE